ncbi:MAG: hypothetical protein IPM29_29990 [Planctomycetes bacterium]|nr:hypothetical protein [Planctomycetota bacterium]
MAKRNAPEQHRWRFYRAGGVDQVRLDTGADIFNLRDLDQKLWVALSCPVKGLEFEERTLALLDGDNDGHVRPPEILAAVDWLREVLKNGDGVAAGRDGVSLSEIRTDTKVGKAVLQSAKHILKSLGDPQATEVTVAHTTAAVDALRAAKLNGDGIVPPATIEDDETRRIGEEILACLGGATDYSGELGFDRARIDAFYAACEAFVAWHAAADADAAKVLPLGAGTAAAVAALDAVRAKIDDYFARCRLAEFDGRALTAVNREESAYLAITASDLSPDADEIAHFPLARVEPGRALPLTQGINPAWRGRLQQLRDSCIVPLLGAKVAELSEDAWRDVCGRFGGYRAWLGARAGAEVESLGIDRVREILASDRRGALEQAVANDALIAQEVEALVDVERLTRLHRDFATLLNNYVSFRDFYARDRVAIFQTGDLYLDGRTCHLCITVNDPGKHGTLATMSKTYLAYVDCKRPGASPMTVACAMTAGDADNLFVGRNGIFYDRKGNDWDATITKIVDQPISVRQAFWAPYKKLLRWIEEQVAKRAAAADEAANTRLQSAAQSAGSAAETGKAPAPKSKFDVGVVAALGVAVGGITAALGALLNSFFGLGAWMPAGVLGLLLLISGPSMLIAWMKLRQRNLGPILDANGWAVNTLTRINLPLGGVLTDRAGLPKGAHRTLKDPYAPKKSIWLRIFVILLVLAGIGFGLWRAGYLHERLTFLPAPPGSEESAQSAPGAGGTPPAETPPGETGK